MIERNDEIDYKSVVSETVDFFRVLKTFFGSVSISSIKG